MLRDLSFKLSQVGRQIFAFSSRSAFGKMACEMAYISEDKVKSVLDWEGVIKATETALFCVSNGKANQNPRTFTNVGGTKNVLLTMPGYLEDAKFGGLGCKLVTAFPENSNLNPKLPTIAANILLFDETNGMLKAVVAGTEITAWRTAAASAVATKHLHKGKKDILAIFGAGTQGRSHALAFQHYFGFKEVRIWNRTHARAANLAKEMAGNPNVSGTMKAFENGEECAKNADVVVTATFSTEPVVKFSWLKQGVHINAVGAGVTHHSELEEAIYRNAKIYVDQRSAAEIELAGLLKMGLKFEAEVGEVMANPSKAPESGNGITIAHCLGMAVEDCATARLVYDRIHKK